MSTQAEILRHRTDTSVTAGRCDQPVGSFMRELSHELGNVAYPLRMVVELQRRSAPLSSLELQELLENQVDALQSVSRRLQRIGRCLMVNIEPELTDVEAAVVVHEAVEGQRHAAVALGQSLNVIRPHVELPLLHGDRDLLVQALSELINNAVCFTPSGGSIRVEIETDGADVEFLVSDNGPGIARELLPRIFEPFVTGRKRMNICAGQIGCGLALVRQVAALHGGAVEVRRTSPEGSVFAMTVRANGRSA